MLNNLLSNDRIVLRPLKNGDDILFYNWRNDLEYIKNTKSMRLPKTQGLEKEWLESNMIDKSNSNIIFIISINEQDIGFIQLSSIDWISRNCYFGIAICEKSFRSQGSATESMRLLFDYAFNMLGIHKISLEVTDFNKNAIDSYEKLGFQKEGTMKEQYYWDNQYYDVHIYGLLKTLYLKKNET